LSRPRFGLLKIKNLRRFSAKKKLKMFFSSYRVRDRLNGSYDSIMVDSFFQSMNIWTGMIFLSIPLTRLYVSIYEEKFFFSKNFTSPGELLLDCNKI
jgi:hypothetical protein